MVPGPRGQFAFGLYKCSDKRVKLVIFNPFMLEFRKIEECGDDLESTVSGVHSSYSSEDLAHTSIVRS